jgi:hypothetical protein
MARQFTLSVSLTSETDAGTSNLKTEIAALVTARTLEAQTGGQSATSGTTLTTTAVPVGAVAAGNMIVALANTSVTAGQTINVIRTIGGAERIICTLEPGEATVLRVATGVSVSAVALSVPQRLAARDG